MVASSEQMYDSIKLRLVCVSSGVLRLFDAVQAGVADPSHSADSIGLNKQIDCCHFVPALLWLE